MVLLERGVHELGLLLFAQRLPELDELTGSERLLTLHELPNIRDRVHDADGRLDLFGQNITPPLNYRIMKPRYDPAFPSARDRSLPGKL